MWASLCELLPREAPKSITASAVLLGYPLEWTDKPSSLPHKLLLRDTGKLSFFQLAGCHSAKRCSVGYWGRKGISCELSQSYPPCNIALHSLVSNGRTLTVATNLSLIDSEPSLQVGIHTCYNKSSPKLLTRGHRHSREMFYRHLAKETRHQTAF